MSSGSGNSARTFSREMFVELEETFQMCDEGGAGVLNRKQLGLALKCFGLSWNKENVDEVLDGLPEFIDFDSYANIIKKLMQHPQWAQLEMAEAFNVYDKDGNGFLDPSELRRVFTRLGEVVSENEIEDQLRRYDIDGDVQMVVAEFMKMVLSNEAR